MRKLHARNSDGNDGGTAWRRKRRHGSAAVTAAMRQVPKRYGTRDLPVSGQEPPRLTKYERERMALREQMGILKGLGRG
jgi:hypothetical protein